MLRPFFAAITLIFLSTQAIALCRGDSYYDQLTVDQAAQLDLDAQAVPYGQGTVWVGTKGDAVLTLIGTVHIYDPRLGAHMARLAQTVQAADLILLEATPAEEAQLQSLMTRNPDVFLNTDGPTLPDVLPEKTWDQLMVALRARDIPPFLAAKFQPWYLMMTLAIPPCVMGDMAAGRRGLEHMIMDEAAKTGIPLQALEPFDTLIQIMQDGSEQEQLEMLALSASIEADQEAMFVAMGDSYFDGDIGKLIALNRFAVEDVAGLAPSHVQTLIRDAEEAIIINRNRAWMPKITAASAKHGDIVVAVGAGHLPDHQGLLALLVADGWTITPF
ncbi:MAG: TraB/GumN family protein [Yoonia sp.]|nr:TraB/GumN family protein [Yoonia sp.]